MAGRLANLRLLVHWFVLAVHESPTEQFSLLACPQFDTESGSKYILDKVVLVRGSSGFRRSTVVQGGTSLDDVLTAATIWEDGSIFLAGSTDGVWSGSSANDNDVAAVTLDANGTELSRWQVTLG